MRRWPPIRSVILASQLILWVHPRLRTSAHGFGRSPALLRNWKLTHAVPAPAAKNVRICIGPEPDDPIATVQASDAPLVSAIQATQQNTFGNKIALLACVSEDALQAPEASGPVYRQEAE